MISEEEFLVKIRTACEAFGIQEFVIYGQFAKTICLTDKPKETHRYVYCDGDHTIIEEAAEQWGNLARGSSQ